MLVNDFKLDQKSSVPYHAQVEKYLRTLIRKKEYASGESLLPKEESLARSFGISRNTIRQAINKLVQEGLIERKKGVGSRVVTRNISTRLDQWISFTKEMRDKGIQVVEYSVQAKLIHPDDAVKKALDLRGSRELCLLEKVRGAENARYLYSISYFHPRIGMTGKEDFSRPLYEMLEQQFGVVVSVSKEKLKAVPATAKVAKELGIKAGHAVLRRERIVCDLNDRPVEYNIVYYVTEYFSYDIDIKREF